MSDHTTPAPLLPAVGDGQGAPGDEGHELAAAYLDRAAARAELMARKQFDGLALPGCLPISSEKEAAEAAAYRRAAAALRAAPVQRQEPVALPPMPDVHPRRPWDDAEPDGYMESFREYVDNNRWAVEWFLENAAAVRAALAAPPAQAAPGEREQALQRVEKAAYAMYGVICAGGTPTLDSPQAKAFEAAMFALWADELDDALSSPASTPAEERAGKPKHCPRCVPLGACDEGRLNPASCPNEIAASTSVQQGEEVDRTRVLGGEVAGGYRLGP